MADQEAATPHRVSADRRAISVLLVDDQRLVGVALERLLTGEQDIELHCCYNAVDAVACANEIGPTLILQDLFMPDFDGLTMVRMFRANPPTADTPIIVLSANDDSGTRARALAEGADDYLVKLPAKVDLVACIRRHAMAAGALDVGDGAVSAQATSAPGQAANETLDRRVIAQFREIDTPGAPDFSLMLIDEFIKEAASQLELLRDARQRQDVRALKATAHSLKGSSMTMGARRLATLCTQMETHADRHPGAVTSALMTDLDQEFVKVREALEAERKSTGQL
jgi:CheY-like chemotaxis protein/HPt (histidine-containing phosphotransfer) domain-containing protein